MNVGRINIDGIETLISLGIDESQIESNRENEDTIELEKIICEVNQIANSKK